MQRHKELYKEQSLVLSPRNHIQTNRERQQERRAKNREECFQNNRIISVSPTPVKAKPQHNAKPQPQPPTPVGPKENEAPPSEQQQHPAQELPPNKKDSKTARHQQFLERFKKWNAARKEELKMQEQLRRGQPIKPSIGTAIKAAAAMPTSAVFRAPVIGQHPEQEKDSVTVFKPPKKRQSLYVIVNPKTKVMEQNQIAAAPQTSRPKVQPTKQFKVQSKPAARVAKPVPAKKTAPAAPLSRPAVVAASMKTKKVPSVMPASKPMVLARSKTAVQPQAVKSSAVVTASSQPRAQPTSLRPRVPVTPATATKMPPPTSGLKTQVHLVSAKLTAATQLRPKLTNVMTQPFEKPAVNRAQAVVRANIVKPLPIRGGAAGKFKAAGIAHKSAGIANKAAGTANKTAHQSIRMKAIKAKSNYTRLEENARKLPQLKTELVLAATDVIPHTPLEEEHTENPFLAQTTSTQYRNCGSLQDAFGDVTALSPVASGKKVGDKVPKRQLLPASNSKKSASSSKKKFTFTRYSVANSDADESLALEPLQTTLQGDAGETTFVQAVEKTLTRSVPFENVGEATFVQAVEKAQRHSLPVKEEDGDATIVQAVEKTPPRRNSEGKSNYLSPFVSVSRGKVNSRSEREKRNSFYLQDGETPAEVRRAIESVMYFRLQLEEEIARLQALCSEWEAYSKANEERLQETGGGDMINVTVGQTRLLTTKKMMQFKGLIDRCEAGAKGKNKLPIDGSEATKPVQPEDLEGWWDMLRLQSDNVDKRFASLERWKANEWLDPDAVAEEAKPEHPKARPKTKLSGKVNMKAKAKPSSHLQQFLRKAHANMKKSKLEEEPKDDGIPPTPSRRSSQRVIVVRDRRSFSPARTVLRMSTGEGRSSIAPNALLKTALIAAAEQNAVDRTPPPKSRPSILKTPGTIKRQNRGVIFSAKKSVRRFQFTIEEGNISTEEKVGVDKLEDCEEDMSLETSTERRSLDQDMTATAHDENNQTPRAYTLRNRRVRLRPSSEFM